MLHYNCAALVLVWSNKRALGGWTSLLTFWNWALVLATGIKNPLIPDSAG